MSLRVVLSDLHIPFESKSAVRLALDAVERLKPSGVDLLGDIWDAYAISRFDKDPTRKLTAGHELKQVHRFLANLREAAPSRCDIRYSAGNHEERLRKYLWTRCPAFADLDELTPTSLLRLKQHRIKWVSYSKPYRIGQLWFHHGIDVRKHSGWSAKAACERVGGCVIVGHCHRMGHYQRTQWHHHIQGWENGCLCDLHPDYMRGGPPDWQSGFSIVRFGSRRTFGVEQVQIRGRRCWIDGKEFRA